MCYYNNARRAGLNKSVEEAMEMAIDCLTGYLYTYNKNGKENFEKSVKKTLTIPSWLNALALENNINFSKVLQDALKQQLKIQ